MQHISAIMANLLCEVSEAASLGDANALEKLLKDGMAQDEVDDQGWIALHHAAYHGQAECIELLLQKSK